METTSQFVFPTSVRYPLSLHHHTVLGGGKWTSKRNETKARSHNATTKGRATAAPSFGVVDGP